MSTELLFGACVLVAVILIRFVLPRIAWFRRIKLRWMTFKMAWHHHKLEEVHDRYNSPESKLKRARVAVEALRVGYWLNSANEKIYLNTDEIDGQLQHIVVGLEANFSYEQMGTTMEEVIGFRNGEAHKASARLQVVLSRTLTESPRGRQITLLAEDAGFPLEEVDTTIQELETLSREYSRRIWERHVDGFRQYAIGATDLREDPDKFERQLASLTSPEHYEFSYAELGTNEIECTELVQRARRREVEHLIDYLRRKAERGETELNEVTCEHIMEALAKARLTLADFNLTEASLDEIKLSAYISRARKLLDELSTPGEGWFYTTPSTLNPTIRFYKPGLWKCIPGDPLYFVKGIKENLAVVSATLDDIGTSEVKINALVRAGHLASAKWLIEELERVALRPRQTQFMRIASMFGPQTMFIEDPNNPIDRTTLEDAYPVDRDIQAITYHLQGAKIELEEIGSSWQRLHELKSIIESK